MVMEQKKTFTAFSGFSRIAHGKLEEVLTSVWEYTKEHEAVETLIFDDSTGKQAHFDLRGTLDEVLRRVKPPEKKKGPGRPRLGVVCSEVCLLPRHWEWLEEQPHKASGTLRRLVESAMRNMTPEQKEQMIIDATGRFMWAVAGDLEGFEEASRALYNRKWAVLDALTAPWPDDVKTQIVRMTDSVR